VYVCRKGEREKSGGSGSELGGGTEVVTTRREDDLLARLSGAGFFFLLDGRYLYFHIVELVVCLYPVFLILGIFVRVRISFYIDADPDPFT